MYYSPNDTKGCGDLSDIPSFVKDSDGDITPFVIAERGECSFVKKVRNIENLGAAVAIIYDDKEEDVD